MKRLPNIVIIILLLSSSAAKADYYLTGKMGTYGFDVENGNSTSTLSGIGAYALDIGYPFADRIMVSLVLNVLYADLLTGDQGFGFDFALKHYPISSAGFSQIQSETLEVSVADTFRPYYGTAFRQREFLVVLATSYVGPSIFFGFDYQWTNVWYANFEVRYDLLQGPGQATATQMNILFGLGKSF